MKKAKDDIQQSEEDADKTVKGSFAPGKMSMMPKKSTVASKHSLQPGYIFRNKTGVLVALLLDTRIEQGEEEESKSGETFNNVTQEEVVLEIRPNKDNFCSLETLDKAQKTKLKGRRGEMTIG
jgi:hypothetical protein